MLTIKELLPGLLKKSLIHWERMLGHRQITDSYLLALAVVYGGRFVSFDQRIRVDLVPDASPDPAHHH